MSIRKKNFIIFLMVLIMAFQPIMTAGMTVSAQVGSVDYSPEKR